MWYFIWRLTLRNLLKNKIYTSINVFGLALGFTAFILIALFIKHELSWDKSNSQYDRIYRVQRHYSKTVNAMDGNDISPHSPAVTAQLLEQFPEFEKATVIRENQGKFLSVTDDRQVYDIEGIHADSCFFDVFTYHFIEGVQKDALTAPFSVVLSRSMCNKLFPEGNALGQRVTLEKKVDLKVTGVYEDLPENSTISPSYIISFSTLAHTAGLRRNSSFSSDCMNFVLLSANANNEHTEDKIKHLFADYKGMEYEELQLCPMKKLHISFNGENDYIVILTLFGVIGMFILIMSAFNYINLTTANAAIRTKEVAIKKISGSSRTSLIIQFWAETILISLLALVLAFVLSYILLPVFSFIVDKSIQFSPVNDWGFLFQMFLVAIMVGVISGIYPAFFLSSGKIVSLSKVKMFSSGNSAFSLKKLLVTFQFAISVFLTIITLSVALQIKHLVKKDVGFQKDDILYTRMTVSGQGVSYDQFRQTILRHPEIAEASVARHLPFVTFGGGMTNWEGANHDEKISCRFNEVSYDFVKNMNIPIVEGRDFSRNYSGDIGKSCLINEAAAKSFGWDNPIGKRLNNNKLTVVGVMQDYIYKDMHNGIEPAILVLAPDVIYGDWSFAFKVNPGQMQAAKAILTKEFEELFPKDPFEIRDLQWAFQTEPTMDLYQSINNTILFFTCVNIFLAIIGLLGLVSFTLTRKTKEIAIRKINGSNPAGIFYLLSREYFVLMLCSFVVAFPGALWMYELIPGAYKLPAQPWVYIAATAIIFTIILGTTSYQTIRAATRNPADALKHE